MNKGELYAIDTDQLDPEIEILYSFIDEIDSYSLETTDVNKINILLDIVPETDTSDILRIKVNNFKPRQDFSKYCTIHKNVIKWPFSCVGKVHCTVCFISL